MTPPDPFARVELYCEAQVAGGTVYVRMQIAEEVYNDPQAREVVTRALRRELMEKILEEWTPVVKVRR